VFVSAAGTSRKHMWNIVSIDSEFCHYTFGQLGYKKMLSPSVSFHLQHFVLPLVLLVLPLLLLF
jgi:hypothetical protein